MRKLFRNFALVAVAAVGVVACSEAEIDELGENLEPVEATTVLFAATPSGEATTKVEFTDNNEDDDTETTGIDLKWELDDAFTLYDADGAKVGEFICTDAESGKFEAEGVTLTEGDEYTAKYNEDATTASQDGDKINNLDAACQMEATFKYSTEGTSITFEHKMAIMTFKFESAERPAKLVFDNGDEASYTVTYTELEPNESNIYTSHIMIEPCEAVSRTLTFSLYATADATDAYDIRSVTTSKAYVAGTRYTSPVSDLDPTVWLGSGTEADPYQISTADQLRQLSTSVNAGTSYSGEYFVMTCDIDLGGIDADGNGIAENEFTAIGHYDSDSYSVRFQGTFDGAGHEVSGLYINQPDSNYQALFGYISNGATVKNLSVSGSVTGRGYVAGIVGSAYSGTTINCYNKATISGTYNYVAGVVAYNRYSTITNCCNVGSVSNSGEYSSTGGIVGYLNNSTAANNYNTGSINSLGDRVGGIVGYGGTAASVVNSYNTGSVSGTVDLGGIVGFSAGVMIKESYFNSDNFIGAALGSTLDGDISTLDNVVGFSTDFMKSTYFVDLLNNGAYSYNEDDPTITAYAWEKVSGDYPTFDYDNAPTLTEITETTFGSGTESDPYIIFSAEQLESLATTVNSKVTYEGSYFLLANDIDLGGSSENPWTAIGGNGSIAHPFQGSFDGGSYTISGLYINSSIAVQGLFGYIDTGAVVQNLTVEGEVTVSDFYYLGGIVGISDGATISNCHNKVTVYGNITVGGVVGYANTGTVVINCFNEASISCSNKEIGGIVGYAKESTFVNCGNIGSVTNEEYVGTGGVVGYSIGASFINCYNNAAVRSYQMTEKNYGSYYGGGFVGYIDSDYQSSFTNCYYNSDYNAYGQRTDNTTYTPKTTEEMEAEAFVATLNANAYSYNSSNPVTDACAWVAVSGSSPMLDFDSLPTTPSGTDIANNGGTYEIYTAAGLTAFADLVNGNSNTSGATTYGSISFGSAQTSINGKLMANITLSGSWSPIGNSTSTAYAGIFDGDGYKVSGISISTTSNYQALFGRTSGATIKNLAVAGSVTITNGSGAAGVVGYAASSSVIINCYNEVVVSCLSSGGGIVGELDSSSIVNCYNSAKITVSNNYAGGIVGASYYSTVDNCYSTAAISGTNVGGVAGLIGSGSVATSCYYNSSTMTSGYGTSEVITANTDITAKSDNEMKATDFVTLLNTGATTYNATSPSVEACSWVATSSSYPTFSW